MLWIRSTFEISHTKHKSLIAMEGIRGFAVFLVFLVHYVTLIEPWLLEQTITYQSSVYIKSIGNIGVDLFFVLSGYLIYGMLIENPKPFSKYLKRRIQRIYPTFTAVFIIYLILSALVPSESKIPSGMGDSLVFIVQNFLLLPGLFDITPIITVAWSLSYEFFYYLLIPLLIAILSLRTWPSTHRILFFLVVSVLAFTYFYHYSGPIRLLMFVSGIVLYDVINSRLITKIPALGLISLLSSIIFVIVFNELDIHDWFKYVMLYILFCIFCLECFISSGLTTRLFSIAPIRWLGNMSYSYYLIHGLCLKFVFLVLGKIYPAQNADSLLFWFFIPLAFFLTLIPSAILFIYVEKPYSLMIKTRQ